MLEAKTQRKEPKKMKQKNKVRFGLVFDYLLLNKILEI